jgi:hypothetical protein
MSQYHFNAVSKAHALSERRIFMTVANASVFFGIPRQNLSPILLLFTRLEFYSIYPPSYI